METVYHSHFLYPVVSFDMVRNYGLLGDDGDNVYLTLDPQYHPVQPDKTCPQSVAIYNEHKDLAKEYLEVQREIQIQSQRMESLVKRLHEVEQCPDPDEEEEERKLEQEKENLLRHHRFLKQQQDLKKNKLKSPSSSSSSGGSGGWMANPHPT
ncbi:hypothetical protein M8J75_012325 [Diaphorina citri]|nr:hypothetical protein M8J75_012325 [Diaphorina citri]